VPCRGHAQNPFQRLSSTIVSYDCFAVAAPGLEPLVATELATLGCTSLDTIAGGVAFHATSEQLYRANLWLRTATRVIVRLARFHASAFYELERHARRISFERFITAASPVTIRVSCRKSRLYHSDAVAERIAVALAGRVGSPVIATEDSEADEEHGDHALVIVRLFHDQCTVSLDSSGALLHRRGYRLATAKAPLRETVAAALIAVSGWDGASALVDPFCGSGTIAIEAALIARRRAPGIARAFAFMRWPEFEPATWASLQDRARELEKPAAGVPILAADRDAGGTEAARANAERAQVLTDIEIRTQALSHLEPPAVTATGWLVTNPPWGLRVGDGERLRDLYAKFGAVARDKLKRWHVTILAPETSPLARETRLPLAPALHTTNGGIPVAMLTGDVPE
jgi:putative N6-adenine-specific DNA methylase